MDQITPVAITTDKPLAAGNGKAFSPARAKAIEMLNQGIVAATGTKDVPSNAQIGYQLICSGVANDPTMGHGWFVLGNALGDLNLKLAAIAAYRRALAAPVTDDVGDLTPEFRGRCLVNLCHTLYHEGKHKEALKLAKQATKEYPDLTYGWVNLSLVHSILGQNDESIAAADRAVAMEKGADIPTAHMAKAFAELHARHYSEAFKWFEARFPYKLKQFLNYPYPKWQGEAGADLFLVSDQGLGDSIDFLRFVPEAIRRCRKIFLGTQPELMRILRSMFGAAPNVEFVPLPQPFPPATHWLTLMSLPVALGLPDKDILNTPLPKWDLVPIAPTWKNGGDEKLHVAIAWAGSAGNEVDRWRSIPIEHFIDLARVPGVEFYSVQVGERSNDLHGMGLASIFRDLSPYIRDCMDNLAVYSHLDLLISVDSAPIHMAGMVDLPAWVPVAFNGTDWRFGRTGRKSIWYPHTKLYRGGMDNDWTPVFENIIRDLRELASEHARNHRASVAGRNGGARDCRVGSGHDSNVGGPVDKADHQPAEAGFLDGPDQFNLYITDAGREALEAIKSVEWLDFEKLTERVFGDANSKALPEPEESDEDMEC